MAGYHSFWGQIMGRPSEVLPAEVGVGYVRVTGRRPWWEWYTFLEVNEKINVIFSFRLTDVSILSLDPST